MARFFCDARNSDPHNFLDFCLTTAGAPSVTPLSNYSATGSSDVIPSFSPAVSTPSPSSSATNSSEGSIVASVDRDLCT